MNVLDEFQQQLDRSQYGEALALAEYMLDSADPDVPFELMAVALWSQAEASNDASDAIRVAMYRLAIDLQRRAHGEVSEEVWESWWSLAAYLDKRGDMQGAAQAYRRMISVAERLVNSEPALLERALNRYAALMQRHGKAGEAESLYRQVIASLEREWPGREERENRIGKRGPSLLEALNDLHRNLLKQGKTVEATKLSARITRVRAARDEGG